MLEADLLELQQHVAALNDGRCREVDAEGCRCLRRDEHKGPHDFPLTPWPAPWPIGQRYRTANS